MDESNVHGSHRKFFRMLAIARAARRRGTVIGRAIEQQRIVRRALDIDQLLAMQAVGSVNSVNQAKQGAST